MLNNDWVISQVEGENIVFPSEESRILSSEIIYYYKLYHARLNLKLLRLFLFYYRHLYLHDIQKYNREQVF